MQKHIFRLSDIRGVVGVDFSVEETYALAQSMVTWLQQKSLNLERIAVAFDGRLYGHEIYQKVAQAIIDAGYQVYFLGICPTPLFVYGLYQLPVQAGIMITASGSAAQFNGFKLYAGTHLVQGANLHELYALHLQRTIASHQMLTPAHIGKIIPCPIQEQYVDAIWQEFAHLSQYDFCVTIDCGHGATGPVIKKLIQKMGWKQVETICDAVEPTFPVHVPEPFNSENMTMLRGELKKRKKSFGIAFDGDGDRMLAMQDTGAMVLGDRLLSVFAQDLLLKHAHRSVAYDMQDFLHVTQAIAQAHGKPIFVPQGLVTMMDAMNSDQVMLGGQLHGRYFFKDRHAGYADGIYAFFRLLDVLVKQRISFDDLLARLPQQMQHSELSAVSNKVVQEYL